MKKSVKHFILGVLAILIMGVAASEVSAGATQATILEARSAIRTERIKAKLAMVQEKAGVEVKNKVAEKIKLKEEKIAAEKKEAAEKKAAAEKETNNQTDTDEVADVTTSASQRGREIGETNRAYGQQLSDPNLSRDERRAIIQEKKDYNRNNHR